jgi:hypothetical protein
MSVKYTIKTAQIQQSKSKGQYQIAKQEKTTAMKGICR